MTMSKSRKRSARITSHPDWLVTALWCVAAALTTAALGTGSQALLPAARATAWPFATLAVIIAGSAVASRFGVFRALARILVRGQTPALAAASVLAFTAVLSGFVNIDVAAVVAMPVGLELARRHGISAGRLSVAIAMTANATSFLLPTSNITTLLLLGRTSVPMLAYLSGSWLAWLLVAGLTVATLAAWLGRSASPPGAGSAAAAVRGTRSAARAVRDLIPMFAAATAIRALLAGGVALGGGVIAQLAAGSALACVANNLPAAAALRPAGTAGLWSAILATAIGPGLLVTGSIATLICRRIAVDSGGAFRARQFTAVGLMLVPAQLAAALLGLSLTGVLR
jgi:arsenical pump membrane protein